MKGLFWKKWFLQGLVLKQDGYVVNCDSQSVLDLSKNATYRSQKKHIDVSLETIDIIRKDSYWKEFNWYDDNDCDRRKAWALCQIGRHGFYLIC